METDIETRGQSNYHFTNWATTYSCNPELYFEPETEDEIKEVLSLALKKGKRVKVVGYGHSPSDLACTADYMISLRKFNKMVHVNQKAHQVTVQGGCVLKELNEKLAELGLGFSVLGTISNLTAAGAIATAVHGTGCKYGAISTYVADMRMMLATGEIITVSREENSDLFPAVAVNLGCLGIILTITFQCEKVYRLLQHQYPNTLKDVIENLDTHITASDHFRFTWFPHTDSVVCFHASRTLKKIKDESSWFWDMFIGYHVLQFLLFLREKTGVVLWELKEWIETTGFPAHFPVEVRFVQKDDLFLSPCFQQDSSFINIIMYRPYNKLVEYESYWSQFQTIVTKHGGRPHWAKDHKLTGADFEKLYPKWRDFCQVREKLDPTGVFLNSNLERVFNIKPCDNHNYKH